jgi:hypothetical protein
LAPRDSFLLRIDPQLLEAVRRWAQDELRSVNGQIEFILRKALSDSGRKKIALNKTSEDKSR